MKRLTALAVLVLASGAWAADAPDVATVQGLYRGTCENGGKETKIEARVVAAGKPTFLVLVRIPGEKKDEVKKIELAGGIEDGKVTFVGKDDAKGWRASWADGKITGASGQGGTLKLEKFERRSETLGAKPPAGAVVLIDGKSFGEVVTRKGKDGKEPEWKKTGDGGVFVPKRGFHSKRAFEGSLKAHVEFKCNLRPPARSQGRGNSGVFLPNGDEIQVLDSFGMGTYLGGGCGGLYKYKDPDAFDEFSLASNPPETWQTYDIEYTVETKDGKPTGKPKVTVYHNGIKIHDNVELRRGARKGAFRFQDHGNPVAYRNIWVLPLSK